MKIQDLAYKIAEFVIKQLEEKYHYKISEQVRKEIQEQAREEVNNLIE